MAPTFAASAVTSAVLLALVTAGCGSNEEPDAPFEPPPLLYVTPPTADLVAGGGPITFTALLRGASGTVAWTLDPAGLGDLSATSGAVVAYLPPEVAPTATTVTLTAHAAGMSDFAAITVRPPPTAVILP